MLGTNVGTVERAAEGVSSEVYRARRGDENFYLRLAEDAALDMGPEVEAHERLRALGVRVAEIVHYEPFAPEVGRSVSITSEIRGVPLIGCTDEMVSRDAARAAGRELALINSIPTQGWGWVLRDGRPGMRGAYASWRSRIEDVIADAARVHLDTALGRDAVVQLKGVIDDEACRTPGPSRLAHGDFDVSQIFVADGGYTGIIDLGEIQGAESHYDLAHFLLHDTEQNQYALVTDVITGYTEVDNTVIDEQLIRRTGVLIGAFRLSYALARWGAAALGHPYVRSMSQRVVGMLDRIER